MKFIQNIHRDTFGNDLSSLKKVGHCDLFSRFYTVINLVCYRVKNSCIISSLLHHGSVGTTEAVVNRVSKVIFSNLRNDQSKLLLSELKSNIRVLVRYQLLKGQCRSLLINYS